ncbi:hypothetical protein M271_44145 [Streptomyces rapamycinicus NRRL 5491]|uniref:Uncharacterized protein n=1 Tax=Streptomyces rapamycinicus TaxID=1226757 RepID=A0ABR6M218_9ACTN|nr:hypothetical protein [Streptomyces rapamycinicus]AGP60197.1 hypothetical protein M271_44145 [Streptomyces rapamycinicus NRRL 5491]MBB4788640.1 hypothetical protein [Streptomyces rapamycinicus]
MVVIGAKAGASGKVIVITAVTAVARTAGQDAATLAKLLLHGRGGSSPDLTQAARRPPYSCRRHSRPSCTPSRLGSKWTGVREPD